MKFQPTIFLGIEVGLKLFLICSLEVVVGLLWKDGTYTYTIAVWVPFESILLAHYSCCWWPLWKQGTCTL